MQSDSLDFNRTLSGHMYSESMPKLLSFGLNILADVFYPKYCFGCRRAGKYLCNFCINQVPLNAQSFCISCNLASPQGTTHPSCIKEFVPDQLISPFPYKHQVISNMIITGKYYFVSETFVILGMMAAEQIKNSYGISHFKDFVICPLPLHTAKKRWRGFNQSELIASAFEHSLHIPRVDLLTRKKNTKTQKDLNSEQRKINMRNAFTTTQEIPEKVILIDDVCTTGQTLMEASKILKQNGAKQVICITLAKD